MENCGREWEWERMRMRENENEREWEWERMRMIDWWDNPGQSMGDDEIILRWSWDFVEQSWTITGEW